jgi:hypothetical protein
MCDCEYNHWASALYLDENKTIKITRVKDEVCLSCYDKTRPSVDLGMEAMSTEAKHLWYSYFRNKGHPFVRCCFCEEEIPASWGNNPFPVAQEGVCCMRCNYAKVIKARLYLRKQRLAAGF